MVDKVQHPHLIERGEWIKFRALHRGGHTTQWRKVNGHWQSRYAGPCPTVTFNGWGCFVVKPHEILEVRPTHPDAWKRKQRRAA